MKEEEKPMSDRMFKPDGTPSTFGMQRFELFAKRVGEGRYNGDTPENRRLEFARILYVEGILTDELPEEYVVFDEKAQEKPNA